jgi:hypothetical protein
MQVGFLVMENRNSEAIREISADDAFLIFEKWYSDKAPVDCSGALWGWSLSFLGRVTAATKYEVSIGLPNGQALVTLRLDSEDLCFGYAEPKDAPFPVPEEAKELSALIVSLPYRITPSVASLAARGELIDAPPREKFIFLELPRE